jgi:hypothetical protein
MDVSRETPPSGNEAAVKLRVVKRGHEHSAESPTGDNWMNHVAKQPFSRDYLEFRC